MRVRIQWEIPRVRTGIRSDHAAALTLSAVLAPASLAAFTVGFWRIAVQLRWTNPVLVWDGALSHGAVWLVAAAVLLVLVSVLDRYGQPSKIRISWRAAHGDLPGRRGNFRYCTCITLTESTWGSPENVRTADCG